MIAIGYAARLQVRISVVDDGVGVCSAESKRVDTGSPGARTWKRRQGRWDREVPFCKGDLGVEVFGGYRGGDEAVLEDQNGLDQGSYSGAGFKMADLYDMVLSKKARGETLFEPR
jgi:hypothetical protein